MNRYLEVLELQPGVGEREIKDAYRKLVKKYHPDVNKDPEASKKFIEVSEAYRFLMEVGARPHQEVISYDYDPYEDEYKKWREEAKAFARKKKQEAEADFRRVLVKVFSYFDYLAYIILFINLLWVVDYILPYKESEEQFIKIEQYVMYQNRGKPNIDSYDILRFENHSILIDKGLLFQISGLYDSGIIYSTQLFGTVIKLELKPYDNENFIYAAFSIYRFFGFLIPTVLLISAAYFRWTQVVENKFSWALLLVLIFLLQVKIFLI